jgi:hypothetical protein
LSSATFLFWLFVSLSSPSFSLPLCCCCFSSFCEGIHQFWNQKTIAALTPLHISITESTTIKNIHKQTNKQKTKTDTNEQTKNKRQRKSQILVYRTSSISVAFFPPLLRILYVCTRCTLTVFFFSLPSVFRRLPLSCVSFLFLFCLLRVCSPRWVRLILFLFFAFPRSVFYSALR